MALNITNDLIQSVIQEVRNHIEELFAVVDSIALLDMLMWSRIFIQSHKPSDPSPK
jgi:hypothetical protein